jgi:hypothetical protein
MPVVLDMMVLVVRNRIHWLPLPDQLQVYQQTESAICLICTGKVTN